MNELTVKNFDTLELNELEAIDGGIGIVEGCLIVAGVIFVAGTITGLCESYVNNRK